MQLLVVAVGQRMPGWADAAFEEYAKRMPPEMRIALREIKAELRSSAKSAQATMRIERERIEQAIPKSAAIVALDERGHDLTTEQLAAQLERWRRDGRDLAFVIGGADGLDADLKARADFMLRLSALTLPHALARVVLAEALYRAWTVSSGHPYHRA